MFEDMKLSIIIALATIFLTLLIIAVVSILHVQKSLMSKNFFLYVFFPAVLLPVSIIATYIVWPGNTLNLAIRLLIAVGLDVLAMGNFYLFSIRFYKATIPEFKDYFEENSKEKKQSDIKR